MIAMLAERLDRRLIKHRVTCDCGRIALFRVPIQIVSSTGTVLNDEMLLCANCYIEYLESEIEHYRKKGG